MDKLITAALTLLLALDVSVLAWAKVIDAETFRQVIVVLIIAVFTGEIAGPFAGATYLRAKAKLEGK